ncbi:hypothetical protein [Streptomyces sp. NPDC003660]
MEKGHSQGETGKVLQLPLPVSSDDLLGRPRVLSPKRPPVETAGLADIFPYYAGFAFEWARKQLNDQSAGDPEKVVLDPWNGSGTTTLAAQYDGHPSFGIDRNPVANLVAQFRCQTGTQGSELLPPKRSRVRLSGSSGDALSNWFSAVSVKRIREWTNSLHEARPDLRTTGLISLFRVVRSVTGSFEGTNPTWVKKANSDEELVKISPSDLDDLIVAEYRYLAERLESAPRGTGGTVIATASSNRLPIADNAADIILTSPPYLTRIDYGIAYCRELAVLGVNVLTNRALRSELMGTTLIRSDVAQDFTPGEIAADLIRRVSSHGSKASSGYYLKQTMQYLRDLCAGFDEMTRVTRAGGTLCMVVQDSYYKDEPVPLANICIDEARARGWELVLSEQFPVRRTLTSMNRSAREYKKSQVSESVITFSLKP